MPRIQHRRRRSDRSIYAPSILLHLGLCHLLLFAISTSSHTASAADNLGAYIRHNNYISINDTIIGGVPYDEIPTLEEISEMGNLSQAVYKYHRWKPKDEAGICEDWNTHYNNSTQQQQPQQLRQQQDIALLNSGDVICHWYRHDKVLGTQVMIVTSRAKDYLAIIFAGTDDLKTSLLDVDVRKTDFGTSEYDDDHKDSTNASKVPVSLKDCPDCKVHKGFNSAVFDNHVFGDIYARVEELRPDYSRFYTTGHSLGAANAILTALAVAIELEEKNIPLKQHPITSINFGCPQLGNVAFRDYVNAHYLTHDNTTHRNPSLAIWRFVMGWDLIPRLPEFFEHIGHTVQMQHDECTTTGKDCTYHHHHHDYHKWFHWNTTGHNDTWHNNITKTGVAYYHHIGNTTLEYAGVPTGWSAKPYVWVPGALLSHAMSKYAAYINDWLRLSPATWVQDFSTLEDTKKRNSSDSDKLIDDDAYSEPPDDDAANMLLTMASTDGTDDEGGGWLWRNFQRLLLNRYR